ncbi:MAG: hypothetical protein PHE33_12490 [Bacteroidales bacterium]|nr:hypothetical protein [Bacteroidales bacterium]
MKKNIFIFIAIILLTGCNRWIAPTYTNVEKLSNVKTGMTVQQVNEQLGIEPYDVYFKGNDDYVIMYNYRVKDRSMKFYNDYNNAIYNESSQNAGKDWYGQEYFCYIYFKDQKVKSIITDEGKKKSEDILIKNNNLHLIQKDEIGFYERKDTIYFVPVKQ